MSAPALHFIPESKILPLEKKAEKLEQQGYVFHITPRAWLVRTRSGVVLKEVEHWTEADRQNGGLSSSQFKRLAHENFVAAIEWAVRDWNERLRLHKLQKRAEA